MSKYLAYRFLQIFLIKFFLSWGLNTKEQLRNFFDFEEGFLLDFFSYLFMFLIFAIGILAVCSISLISNLTQKTNSSEKLLSSVEKKGIKNKIKIFPNKLATHITKIVDFEFRFEKYPIAFLVTAFIFLFFIKGNPIINNYYGIYKEYEIVVGQDRYGQETTKKKEEQYFIVPKEDVDKTIDWLNSFKSKRYDYEEDYYDNNYSVKKRGYLFAQTALIDGYEFDNEDLKGFGSYIVCLFFAFFEKLTNTIMYFLIPFILFIATLLYLDREPKTK